MISSDHNHIDYTNITGMLLLTKENLSNLPPLYSQDGKGENTICHVKYFNPTGRGYWFITEFDPPSGIMFGLCAIHVIELGEVSIRELCSTECAFGLGIERDLHYSPMTVGEARKWLKEHGYNEY